MGNKLLKSCCTATQNGVQKHGTTLTTVSSELQKMRRDLTDDFTNSLLKNCVPRDSQGKNSINLKSTRKLSDECGAMLNLPEDNISQHYKLLDPIGSGKYGKVYLGQSIHDKQKQTAIKVIKIRKIKSNFESVMKEIQMMKSIDHPDIVKVLEIYRDSKKIYLVMELVQGEELFDYILRKEKLREWETRKIIRQLVQIVKYLNSVKIAHRDLKPENIMINSKSLKIKLLDFGLSSYFEESKKLVSPVGTPYYVAPEVLRGSYGKECDMWSIGIITFICLTGAPPFQGDSLVDIYQDILKFNLVFNDTEWSQVSGCAISFVRKLLEPKICNRLCPERALRHSWLCEEESTFSESRKSRNPDPFEKVDYDQYKFQTFEVLRKLVQRNILKECSKCANILVDPSTMESLSSSRRRPSPNCICCRLLDKISPMIELFVDANIEFNEFLSQVTKDFDDIQPDVIGAILFEIEGDKENYCSSMNISSSNSKDHISFEMRSVNNYDEEISAQDCHKNVTLKSNIQNDKSALTLGTAVPSGKGTTKSSAKDKRALVFATFSQSKGKELCGLVKQATLSHISCEKTISCMEGKDSFINSY
ncbi:unnamed protein product [Moneuplotes crassus]|uniref:non-specific serine/threonine protein kinase n=1 Tax=Euplotes crassus TaxID=5936 RepID=A0AAD1X8N2_EUPCR|nr:unnamed protein product [Moneuplotes crassus]